MTIAELLVQATATLTTASTPDGLVWCKRSECLAEARAIVVAIYGKPCDRRGDVGVAWATAGQTCAACGWPASMHAPAQPPEHKP